MLPCLISVSFQVFLAFLWWQKNSDLILYPFKLVPGEKWFGLNRTTVLLCSVLLDVSTGLRDAGFRATFVAFGSTPSFSEAVFLPFPPSVWSVLQTHAQSVHTLALTNNPMNSNIVTHVPSVSHVEHLGAHKHIFFPTTGAFTVSLLLQLRGVAVEGQRERENAVCQHYIKGCMA